MTVIATSVRAPLSASASDAPVNSASLSAAGVVWTVVAWRDETIEQTPGVATDSDEALVWYTPSIGCTGMAIAHRLARYAADGPSRWTTEDLALTFGIGMGGSARRLRHSLDRLAHFGVIRLTGSTVAVRLWLPPLTMRQRARLPGYLAAAYAGERR